MISIAFDTDMIEGLLAVDSTNEPLASAFRGLIEHIDFFSYRVVIPRPVFDECQQCDRNFISEGAIDRDSALTVAEFDAAAVAEEESILQKLRQNACLLGNHPISSPRRKTDIRIIAIARVQNVRTIYSNDRHFKSIVSRAGLQLTVKNREDILMKYCQGRTRNA